MSKYRIKLQPKNIWADEKVREVIALDIVRAKETCLVFNKGCTVSSAVRIGQEQSTLLDLMDLNADMVKAIDDKNTEIFQRHSDAFDSTVKSLKGAMNSVSWGMTKKHIPRKPILY